MRLQSFCGDMPKVYCREITRRISFKTGKIPWIARFYIAPFKRWNSLGRQALFGAPNFLAFFLFQKFWPFKTTGTFTYQAQGRDIPLTFNAKNTQFQAVYSDKFSMGYEPQISALLEVLLPDDGIFYDIGSNWGWFTLHLAAKPNFQGSVHAFEPFPPSYSDFCSMIEQAGLANCVQAHHLALSDHVGRAAMRLPDKFQSGQAVMEESAGAEMGTIPTASLDSLKLAPPDLIKADVEGVETRVFKGASQLLSQHKPMLVFENSRDVDDAWNTLEPLVFLQDLGYEFFQVGWLRTSGPHSFLIGDDADPKPQSKEILALSPFCWEERLLRYDGMNVFACHRDRISELKTLFTERTLQN
jgi:FkbM family methyltransferase